MSFDVHPILEPGQLPTRATWYAIAPEDTESRGSEGSASGAPGPSPRVGVCANYFQLRRGTGAVLVSAGANPEGPYSDLYQLTLKKDKMCWTTLPSDGLPPRYEHASFITSPSPSSPKAESDSLSTRGNSLYVFAGAKPEGPVLDMWKYSLDKQSWEAVKMDGPIPSPRTYHSSSSVRGNGQSLVVFSGGDAGMSPVADQQTHLFDLKTNKWRTLDTSGTPPPSPRQGHVVAVVGSRLYVHGGMAGQEIFSDLHCLDLDTLKWSRPEVGGAVPPPLAAHGCAVIAPRIYMFGGLSSANPGSQDTLYCLNTETLMWTELSVSGPPPPARLDHAMCAVKIPVVSTAASSTQDTTRRGRGSGGEGEGRNGEAEPVKGSFQAVTVINPEDNSHLNLPVSKSASACNSGAELVSSKLESLDMREEGEGGGGRQEEECMWVWAVFVFGGMDTAGNIHGDSFLLIP